MGFDLIFLFILLLLQDITGSVATSLPIFFQLSVFRHSGYSLTLFCFETLGSITWSIQILFCILVSYVSVMFDCLKDNFQTILKAPNASQIETWRRNHVLVCQLVDNINDCFGVVLLISVGCYFVSSISASYELYVLL